MDQMLATAERLHAVEDAVGDFLMRWAVDELLGEVGDRVQGELDPAMEKFSVCEGSFSHYRGGLVD